jgi:hypothetical protein
MNVLAKAVAYYTKFVKRLPDIEKISLLVSTPASHDYTERWGIMQCCGSASKKCGCGCGSRKKSQCGCGYGSGCGYGFMPLLNYGEPSNSIRNL